MSVTTMSVATISAIALRLVLAGAAVALGKHAAAAQARSYAVSFPTRDVAGFRDLHAKADGYDAMSVGTLVLPAATAPPHGYPAMVILHGSGGEWSGRGARQADFLAAHGVAALVVDTYAGRGLTREMRYLDRLRRANMPDQIADAFAALDLLAAHPDIDARRIGVMGYSMGGTAALLTAQTGIARAAGMTPDRFALHVAFYAPCFVRTLDAGATGAPLVVVWGTDDESTDETACAAQVDRLQKAESPVAVHWLDGAPHGWNGLGERAYHPTAPRGSPCDFVVEADGRTTERVTGRRADTDRQLIAALVRCTEWGYAIGRDAAAEDAANHILLRAIAEQGGKEPE